MHQLEYSASEIRKILQELFPERRLVLSQFTFFNQVGVSNPTGETFRRGRRCYRLIDLLSIASVLALKEEGIPYKNVEALPGVVQKNSERIFAHGPGVRISGFGSVITIRFPGEASPDLPLDAFLNQGSERQIYWGFDVGVLAHQLTLSAEKVFSAQEPLRAAFAA